ncbi:hypothetical protein conserved [Leishmania donovani]|uniref:Uncharacterized protein n=4 Tax=Leishmania donovani species complex TaxID=38574 RepID=A4HU59_LEIIN|nr:conserved hypothetical protein [Leishmania infantum JPCM5]XP_003858822.1 hypothetical protein, conserved [Leishmania donovani]CAC9455572.1 hypothetical_protein_-__conserved [Leishmania infantum]CAJ1986654.1 hypothetical protein conserved [Leishmania donovani]CAM65966.1 conserved hypothetical protein [Leishmania infantum JPCM5]CBZ32102.1 hypothetical protein, conserved [Leishmania donovani]SUZ39596.1 hypothetical_protein_-__conserved [Leishmania infantum]|eukprot:XP_001463600.1 conserved hypothetical protein [Leishmania infantum JPCM5]
MMMPMTGSRNSPVRPSGVVRHAHETDKPVIENCAQSNPLLDAPPDPPHKAGKRSVVSCAPSGTSSAARASDVAALLRHAVVRDLIRENEGMLMEIAGLQETKRLWCATQLRLVTLEESAARAALKAAESIARGVWATRAHASLAAHVQRLEQQLSDEAEEAAELRGFAELAQAQLATSPRPQTEGATPEKEKYASPPAKGRRGSGMGDVDGNSQRASLEEITNVRGSVKRLRSVESSDSSGTPRGQARRTSSSQKSPGALTKVCKTIY